MKMEKPIYYHYHIAYKTPKMESFSLVKSPPYGWVADPFLVEYDGDIYLFAEIFLWKTERNGVIGYSKYDGTAFGAWTVTMDRHWHLSYPNVYTCNGRLYMCPESYQSLEVSVYELVQFPNTWRKVHTYINDVEYCDSTFLHYGNDIYMFTFERQDSGVHGNGYICKIMDGRIVDKRLISSNPEGSRPGGNILQEDGKYFRVAQNGKPAYGSELIIYEIDSLWPNYTEHEIKRITIEDLTPDWKEKYCGIHTYNKLKDIEVIDLKEKTFSMEEYEAQQRVRSIFLNKYR